MLMSEFDTAWHYRPTMNFSLSSWAGALWVAYKNVITRVEVPSMKRSKHQHYCAPVFSHETPRFSVLHETSLHTL